MKRKLQVFVSSTFLDLQEERQAAVSAILKAGHIPAGMELFTAGDRSQMQTIERWIDESDVYMLILGGRYGSVEPTSKLSYTELEYDYAKDQGKPIFAVVMDDNALEDKIRAKGTDFMEKEHRQELGLFKDKVLSYISSFFKDAKDVKLAVYESLSDFALNRDLKGWVSAAEIEDTQLLKAEIERLREENYALKETLRSAEEGIKRTGTNKSASKVRDSDFDELSDILKLTPVKIPTELAAEKIEKEIDLLTVLYHWKEPLLLGVTNNAFSTPRDRFLYHKLSPLLQLHGLVDNEKIAGVQYRRSFLNKKGIDFLSYLNTNIIKKRAVESKAPHPSEEEGKDKPEPSESKPKSSSKSRTKK